MATLGTLPSTVEVNKEIALLRYNTALRISPCDLYSMYIHILHLSACELKQINSIYGDKAKSTSLTRCKVCLTTDLVT